MKARLGPSLGFASQRQARALLRKSHSDGAAAIFLVGVVELAAAKSGRWARVHGAPGRGRAALLLTISVRVV